MDTPAKVRPERVDDAPAIRAVHFVVVPGDPAYYRQFGFSSARSLHLENEFGADDEFMAIVWRECLPPSGGLVMYAPEFAAST